MKRVGFIMKMFPGYEQEYRRRHDLLWPELQSVLKAHGISDYSIFLHRATNQLFAYLTITDAGNLEELRKEPVMQKWWHYMKDIMESNPDASPVSEPLDEIFYLP